MNNPFEDLGHQGEEGDGSVIRRRAWVSGLGNGGDVGDFPLIRYSRLG